VDYERKRLRDAGPPDLADAVQWVARDIADGLGYDVLSFELSGEELYIEVKTTGLAAETPFYFSSAELDFARRHAQSYALYRVSQVDDWPQFFVLRALTSPISRWFRSHTRPGFLAAEYARVKEDTPPGGTAYVSRLEGDMTMAAEWPALPPSCRKKRALPPDPRRA
jgi:hypothetical protein